MSDKTGAEYKLLSNDEEAALDDKLYEDIKSGRLSNVATIGVDRGWNMVVTIHRVKRLIEAGRVGYTAANEQHEISLYARAQPPDVIIDGMNEGLVGRKLTRVSKRIDGNGDQYTRLHFGDVFYEYLSAFTANDDQVAVAKEALQKIVDNSGFDGIAAKVARAALAKMETFK